jgi:hypothetical protein
MAQALEQEYAVEADIENRKSVRTSLRWPVSVWLPEVNRFYSGTAVNIAKGGVMIKLPMTAPIQAGNLVEINLPRTTSLAKKKDQFARIMIAKVLRVQRESITNACIAIAMQFVKIAS